MARPKHPIGTALVADDHAVTRYGLLQFLRDEMGVRTTFEAERFEAAIEILLKQNVTLFVCDLGLPGLDNARALEQVRIKWPDVKLVVLSGSERRSDILAALAARIHGYIIKTASLDTLADRLGYVMSGQIYVPPCLAEPGEDVATMAVAEEGAVAPSAAPALSKRQLQVLHGLVAGHTNKQIAVQLKLAEGTVKMHVGNVCKALGVSKRGQAALAGRRLVE